MAAVRVKQPAGHMGPRAADWTPYIYRFCEIVNIM